MIRGLGTKNLNAPHRGIRNQVSNMGLGGKALTQVIGNYIRNCLYLSCREIQANMIRMVYWGQGGMLGFNANNQQAKEVADNITIVTESAHNIRELKYSVYLNETGLSPVTRYLLFNKKRGTYPMIARPNKMLRWNPIDEMNHTPHGDRTDILARKVNHPYYEPHNNLDRLVEDSRNKISVSKIFREKMPELKKTIASIVRGELVVKQ